MKIFYKKIILLFVLLISLQVFSQQDDEKIITNQLWVDYYQYFYFKPKWEYYGDAGYRSLTKDFSWQMIHFRPSVRYIPSDLWEARGGIGLFQTFNKDVVNTFEIRPWQGAIIMWPTFKSFLFSHYFRVEERIVLPAGYAAEFNLRLRYQIKLKINIYKSPRNSLLYIPLYAEWFLDVGEEIHETFSNRARYAIGLAYQTQKNWVFEFYFVRQNSRSSYDGGIETADHLFQFKLRRHLSKIEKNKNE